MILDIWKGSTLWGILHIRRSRSPVHIHGYVLGKQDKETKAYCIKSDQLMLIALAANNFNVHEPGRRRLS
jgi:hypothetical protein